MTIQVGDKIPSTTLFQKNDDAITKISSQDLFAGKRVAFFALPGAFTPTCSAYHLPGYVEKAEAIFAKNIDLIICLSVNDPHVMAAWGEQFNVADKVMMIADGNGDFTRAVGLEIDRSESGMGMRSQRYSMVANDGTIELLNIEETGKFEISDADTLLNSL